jgi:hypothetical protein
MRSIRGRLLVGLLTGVLVVQAVSGRLGSETLQL